MKRYFIGCDASKHKVHLAILDSKSNLIRLEYLETSGRDDIGRMGDLSDQFESWLVDFSIEQNVLIDDEVVLCIEGPIYLQNIKTSFSIAQTVYGIELAAYRTQVPCFEVPPTSWKKMVLGNGAAKKEDILKFAETKWGKGKFKEQDYADAACIAHHQYMLIQTGNESKSKVTKKTEKGKKG
jgi:Holliday junction resolvasome RuvABC endonuclease subunit